MAKKNTALTGPMVIFASAQLKTALAFVGGGVKSNPIVPILENVKFSLSDGQATLTGSDLTQTLKVTIPCETTGGADGDFLLPYLLLKSLVDKMSSQPVVILIGSAELGFGHTLKLDSGTYKLASENPIDFPGTKPAKDTPTIVSLTGDDRNAFETGLRSTIYAVSKDDLRPAMTGVFIRIDEALTMVATNGHILTRYRISLTAESKPLSIILPAPFVRNLIKLLDGQEEDITLTLTINRVVAQVGVYSIESPLIDERFPDYENALPMAKQSAVLQRQHLIETINRILTVANQTTHQIRMLFAGEVLVVSAEDMDYGNEGNEQMPCSLDKDTIEIGFNGRFLLEHLQRLEGEKVTFHLTAPNRGATLTGEDDGFLGLVMPVMLNTYA